MRMVAFLVYLSVMGNAAAVVALALHLDPKLTFLPWKILFFIGEVPLALGICIIIPMAEIARDDYRRRARARHQKRMSADPAGIALRARLEEEGRLAWEEKQRKKQLRHERIKAELAQQEKDMEISDRAFREEFKVLFAARGPLPAYRDDEFDKFRTDVIARIVYDDDGEYDEFRDAVAARHARYREQTANG